MMLRDLISLFEQAGELRRVCGASAIEEIGALTEMNAKREKPHALLFDEIQGYPAGYRVFSGMLDSPLRLATALGFEGVDSTEALLAKLENGRLQRWIDEAESYPLEEVERDGDVLHISPCESSGLNLDSFPAPLWHSGDGGRYIGTACSILTQGPDGGWVNAGCYRTMIKDPESVTISFSTTSRHGRAHVGAWWDAGRSAPVAIVVGGDPLLAQIAGVEVPFGISELQVAAAIRRKPMRVVKSDLTGLPIPADAELVLEGFISAGDESEEGPFGEATGYYASAHKLVPVARIQRIWHRKDTIILGGLPSKPPHDFEYPYAVIRSALMKDSLKAAGVTGVHAVWTSFSRQWTVVSVKQEHPGHGRQAAYIAANCGPGAYFSRYVVAVDHDINPQSVSEVLWAILTRADPGSDIEITRKGWGSPIDPMGNLFPEGHMYNTRAIIDATIPYTKRDLFPKVATVDPDRMRELSVKWADLFGSR